MPRYIGFFGFLIILLSASLSFADPQTEAQKHFDDGAAFYFNHEYGKAIVEFMKGNDLYPNALFLYNISLCHSHLGNLREGIDNAVRAKNMGGLDPATETQNDARIVSMGVAQTARFIEVPVEDPVEEIVQPTEPQSTFGALGWVGVGTTVAGVGLLVGAGAVELSLQSTWEEYEEAAAAGDEEKYSALQSDIEDLQTTGLILLAAGAGVSIVGLTLIVVDLSDDESPQPVVFFSPDGSGYAGVAGRF